MALGVGIIGAGPGVAALHLPTLARFSDELRVVHISDAGSGQASQLAARVGARSSSGIEDLLADGEVSVVVICSPPAEHAAHILAAVDAGIKIILCEKPLAQTAGEAQEVATACRDSGTAVLVGTNHRFDAGWIAASDWLDNHGGEINSVTVTLALPPNGRYHELVTELAAATASHPRAPDLGNAAIAASVVRQLVIGLAVHDLPALRRIVPRIDEVVFARPLAPIGFSIGARGGEVAVQLTTVMLSEGADALWRLSVDTSTGRIDIDFAPAFVHAGGARVRVITRDGSTTELPRVGADGYLAEWRAVLDLAVDPSAADYDALLDDALYAVALADGAHDAVLRGFAG